MTSTPFPHVRTPAGPVPADAPAWNRQRHSQMPSHRYRDVYSRVAIPLTDRDREWPARRLTRAPLWVPVDLRDGNQALAEPMDPARKRRFFGLMVAMGYKEIEVGYPSASQTDFDFVRLIAGTGIAPADVTIVVFTPARRDLIERTAESIAGITNPVVIHMYTATAPTWRDVVLGHGRNSLRELILAGGRDVLRLMGDLPNVRFEFSPEVFNLTEPGFALEVCDAVTGLWDASPDRPVIVNLPATVEIATPNVYADQIEYMHKNLARRDAVILSVHPHNDRGTGIACAELAVLAGAQRVEGCVFGNGERTGNVDIAALALNLHAQGIDPMIDFSDIDEIRRTVEYCNRIEIHPRHPYAGDLVHTAFSGTHQDAIRKGLAEHRAPPAQASTITLIAWETAGTGGRTRTTVTFSAGGSEHTSTHDGTGPVEALTSALAARGITVDVLSLHQTSIGSGNDAGALTILEYRDRQATRWAAGRDRSVLAATLAAVTRAAAALPATAAIP